MRTAMILIVLVSACGDSDHVTPDAGVGVDGMPDAGSSLSLALEHSTISAPRSIGVEIDITIARSRFDGDVMVMLAGNSPAGLSAPVVTIPAGESTETFVLWLDDTIAAATYSLEIVATGGGATATGAVDLVVDPDAPSFKASWVPSVVEPAVLERVVWLAPGWTSQVGIHLYQLGDYAGTPELAWVTPANVTGSGASTTVRESGSHVYLPIAAATDASDGDSAATLIVSDGNLRAELSATIWISTPGLDTAIGTGGRAFSDPAAPFYAVAIDVDAAGRPLVLGSTGTTTQLGARRYTATGALDTAFGTNGTATIATAAGAIPVDGLVTASDALYVLASTQSGDVGVARLAADGSADATWGENGWRTFDVGHESELPVAIRVHNGNLYLLGRYANGETLRPDVICMTTDGAACSGFGSNGVTEIDLAFAVPRDLALDQQGRVLVAGATSDGFPFVARLTAGGALDTTFGEGGVAMFPDNFGGVVANAVATDDSGRIVLVGHANDEGSAFIARFAADGSVDTTFSMDGSDMLHLVAGGSHDSYAFDALHIGTDGITVVGTRNDDSLTSPRVAIVRYDHAGTRLPAVGRDGVDWLLGGNAERERVFGARLVGGQLWIGAHASSDQQQHVILKYPGL